MALDVAGFKQSLSQQAPPEGMGAPLRALWHEARGEWEVAHQIVQAEGGPDAARVHAYLHRKEGDLANAAYWYRRANTPAANGSSDAEWDTIVSALLRGE